MQRVHHTLAALTLAAGFGLASCGDDDDEPAPGTEPASGDTTMTEDSMTDHSMTTEHTMMTETTPAP